LSIHVQLDRFEGPLGLLLHLIREQEMDIFNINIHHITRQYLEYIKTMRRLDLEVAGEFVAMAATLLHIKSKMLLPQYNEEGEEVSEDPRKELVQKLLEYKKFRELSADLYKRALLGRDVFPRNPVDDIEAAEEGELVLEENPLFSLIASYRMALKNMKKTVHRVASELQSIASRILEIKDRLMVGNRVVFRDLITAQEGRAGQVLVTFLSLLELAKMGFISVFQNEPFSDIHVETKKVIDRDIVSQVESYDSVNAESTADSIMANAQLSLTEPEANFEGEEAPVVVASPADAASDDEIAAEEALLEGAEGQQKSLLPEEIASDDDIEMELARMAAEDRGEVYVPPVVAETVAFEQFESADESSHETPKLEPQVNSALSAALSAFDAFNEIKDPEVDL
jgi:segregation and condensation protein A